MLSSRTVDMSESEIDHRAMIASLSNEDRKMLTARSDAAGLVHLSIHVAALMVTGSLILNAVPYWQLILPIHGVLLIFLFTLLHEAIHETVFKTKWINTIVARICGFLIALPPDWFRYFHFAHHRHTNDPDNDPELGVEKPETLRGFVFMVSGIPVWIFHIKTLFRNAWGRCDDPYVPKNGFVKVRREARIMLLLYGVLIAGSFMLSTTVLLWLWVVPAILGQPFLRLYLMAEHGRCPQVANMLENSRTTFTNALMRRLAWNMPYHAEHHAYPSVPFHKLPELHKFAKAHLKVTQDGYTRFHAETVRQFAGADK